MKTEASITMYTEGTYEREGTRVEMRATHDSDPGYEQTRNKLVIEVGLETVVLEPSEKEIEDLKALLAVFR